MNNSTIYKYFKKL